MIYTNMTYETILNRMMESAKISQPNIDTREGSILFNALAPAAMELAMMYYELDNVLSESFVETASREYLLTHCVQMGMDVSVFSASPGVHKGVFNVEVPLYSRWSCDLYNYVVTEYIGVDESNNHEYKLTCETVGSKPNSWVGDLISITYISNDLTYAKITECLVEGEEETPDEDIRVAYYNHVGHTAVDGNVAQYEKWCREYPGVGNYKITPLWNGDNTVKVSILSASNGVASDELVSEFQKYLDPNSNGMGDGVAPIGSKVTVTTAEEVHISCRMMVKKTQGYADDVVEAEIEKAIKNYLSEIAYKTNVVSYMGLGAAILNSDGVYSLDDLELEQGSSNIVLGDEQIAVFGQFDVVFN